MSIISIVQPQEILVTRVTFGGAFEYCVQHETMRLRLVSNLNHVSR